MFRSVIRTRIGCIVSQENADGVIEKAPAVGFATGGFDTDC